MCDKILLCGALGIAFSLLSYISLISFLIAQTSHHIQSNIVQIFGLFIIREKCSHANLGRVFFVIESQASRAQIFSGFLLSFCFHLDNCSNISRRNIFSYTFQTLVSKNPNTFQTIKSRNHYTFQTLNNLGWCVL